MTEMIETHVQATDSNKKKKYRPQPSKNQTSKLKLSSTMQGMEMSFTNPTTRAVP